MKLLYYLPAIGNNNLAYKHEILLHNLQYIYTNIQEKFSISINFYNVSDEIKKSLQQLDFLEHIYIYEKKGVLTELFLTSPSNEHISSYDYILFILDDVKITNIDIPKMIEIKEKHTLDILSPRVINSTHSWMNSYTNLTIHNFLEVYCLLVTPAGFFKFCSLHTIENKWMWGVDMLFGYYNVRAGVIHSFEVNHMLPTNSNQGEALYLMDKYIQSKTKYANMGDIVREFPVIQEQIDDI
jgi:hypothetical protein